MVASITGTIAPVLLVVFSLATPAPAAEIAAPTCDQFRERLENADRILQLRQIKPIRLSREPQEENGDDLWTVHDDDGDEVMDVNCREGRFVSLQMIFPAYLGFPHPQFDYIAAGIFGFTGWLPDEVIKTATEVLNTKRAMKPEWEAKADEKTFKDVRVHGMCGTISYSEFTLGDCD